MARVTVWPKFQIVIPREVRDSLSIKPGEELKVFRYGDHIEPVPMRSIRDMRGFLKESTRPPMNVVDSSGWLEYVAERPNADFFAPALLASGTLGVPTISILEVGKIVHLQREKHSSPVPEVLAHVG